MEESCAGTEAATKKAAVLHESVMPSAMDGPDAWRWRNENDAMNTHNGADHRLSPGDERVGTSGTCKDGVVRHGQNDGSWH